VFKTTVKGVNTRQREDYVKNSSLNLGNAPKSKWTHMLELWFLEQENLNTGDKH
jgi:hypothetical protein